MKNFRAIEEKHRNSPVVTDDPKFVGSGTLILDGKKSSAVLQSADSIHARSDENGWFDLRLKGSNGQTILLHNALTTHSTRHHSQSGSGYEEHIYPNAVVLGAEALVDGNKVSIIVFTLRDLGRFFHYQQIEWQSLYNAPKAMLASLRKLRKKHERPYDVFNPIDLYVVHELPTALKFKVEGRRYEVFIGSQAIGPTWGQIDYKTDPIASIRFDKPVGIDEAIDAVWQWKRYFGLLTLNPMPLTSLAARSGKEKDTREAEFYLPNHAEDDYDERGPFQTWLGNIPLNRWNERKALGQVMKTWIAREKERQRFRSSIDAVASRLGRHSAINDIVMLCAGIESLSELDTPSALTTDQVKILSKGALDVAKAQGIEIDASRIAGVIGFLRNTSLPQRMRSMFDSLGGLISKEQAKTLIAAVQEMRTIAAHGASPAGDVIPKAGPTLEALACACALYDLLTCGMPVKSASDQRLGLISHMDMMLGELDRLKALKASSKRTM